MLKSLNSKVIFSIAVVTLLGVFLTGLVVVLTVRLQMYREYGIEKEAAVESLSLALAGDLESGNHERIEETIKSALVYQNIETLTVYDINGKVVASSSDLNGIKTLDISRHTLAANGVAVGSFEAGFSNRYINELVENTVIALIIVVAGFLLLVGTSLFLFIRHSVLQPIRRFTGAIGEMNTGNLSVRIDIDSEDEIGFLAGAFNGMTENLQKSQAALQQSHDELEEKVNLRTRGERRRTEQLRTINEVGRKISSYLSLDELLVFVVSSLKETFNYYTVNVFLTGESNDVLELRAGTGGYEGEIPAGLTVEYGRGIIGAAAENGGYLIVPDVTVDERFLSAGELPGTCSELAVPITLGDEVMGVLDVRSDEVNAFDEIDVFTVQTIADQLAVAIQNTRYYSETRELAVITERNRLAREIHDTLAQGFTGIIMQLEAAEQAMENDETQALKHLETARRLARESLNEARRSVWALRPQALEQRSFIDALRTELETLRSETYLHIQLSVPDETMRLSPDVENALLRIMQEAFNNIRKHAEAENVRVTLEQSGSDVRLTVEDDGIGFDTTKDRRDRFGLISMRERAKLLGGLFEITSETGKGTRLTVTMPAGERMNGK